MEKYFVKFYSPGTFIAEQTTMPIDSYDVAKACELSKTITERYNAKPYGFQFITKTRGDDELDSHVSHSSRMYYLDGKVMSLEEIEERHNPDERILLSNMQSNNWSHVVRTYSPYSWTQPLETGDCVVDSDTGEIIFKL